MDARLLLHGLIALTIVGVLLAWGVLLSPPMKWLREYMGFGELEGARFNQEVGAAEIIAPGEGGEEFLGRIAHYYHALFMVLLYGTLVVLIDAYRVPNGGAILLLMLLGSLMSVIGGIVYAYIDHSFQWHGLFIGGLAVCFSAGLLALASYRPRDLLGLAAWLTGSLLIVGGFIGGYIGSSFMVPDYRDELVTTIIETRFDPSLGDKSEIWRAWTGHQHAMIALSLTLAFLAGVKYLDLKESLLAKLSKIGIVVGAPVMALASFSVWFIGKSAHLVITPAAVILITGTLLLSFSTKTRGLSGRGKALAWALRIGNLGIWAFVAVPGAIMAMSLEESSPFFETPVRSPELDWMELSFNIGHWHLLLLAWGVLLGLVALHATWEGRLSAILSWLFLLGFMGAGIGTTLYIFTAEPAPYSPNPYDNTWLRVLIEPSLALVAIAVLGTYFALTRRLARAGLGY